MSELPPIVLGAPVDDAWAYWPGRNQLFSCLAEHNTVIFLERPRGALTGRLSMTTLPDGSFCVQNACGLTGLRYLERLSLLGLAAWLDGVRLHRLLRGVGFDRYIYWLQVPEPGRLLRGIRPAMLVYDAMDPCLDPACQADHDRREAECVRRADVVFATAASLERRVRAFGALDPVRLPNAALAEDLQYPVPDALYPADHANPARVATYLGTVDGRVDVDLIAAVASRLPEWKFVIAGRINPDRSAAVAAAAALANVTFTGPVNGDEGRALISGSTICLIPFYEGAMNDGVNSVKMFTYLALGKPVVSTDVEECRANPYVRTASGPDAFAQAIRDQLDVADSADERRRFAAENTWEKRADTALAVLSQAWERTRLGSG